MRLLLAANNQATRRNEIIKSYLQLGSSSNRYAPRLPQQETKSSTKQLPPTGPILGPENILKTGFAQKGLPSSGCPVSQRAFYPEGLDGRKLWCLVVCEQAQGVRYGKHTARGASGIHPQHNHTGIPDQWSTGRTR